MINGKLKKGLASLLLAMTPLTSVDARNHPLRFETARKSLESSESPELRHDMTIFADRYKPEEKMWTEDLTLVPTFTIADPNLVHIYFSDREEGKDVLTAVSPAITIPEIVDLFMDNHPNLDSDQKTQVDNSGRYRILPEASFSARFEGSVLEDYIDGLNLRRYSDILTIEMNSPKGSRAASLGSMLGSITFIDEWGDGSVERVILRGYKEHGEVSLSRGYPYIGAGEGIDSAERISLIERIDSDYAQLKKYVLENHETCNLPGCLDSPGSTLNEGTRPRVNLRKD